jgi:hypothetical protein
MKKLISLITAIATAVSITACVPTDTSGTVPPQGSTSTSGTSATTAGTTASVKPTPSNNRNFVYELLPDGTYSITKVANKGMPMNLVIPSEYLSTPVTVIATDAFRDCENIKSVYIPASIKIIGVRAFTGCEKLENVIFEENSQLKSIYDSAFASCSALTQISIPKSATDIRNYVFASCTSLESIVLPEGLTEIGKNLFNRCYALNSVNIPASVTVIRSEAFFHCTSLKSIVIPKNVSEIERMVFEGAALEHITFEKGSALKKFTIGIVNIKEFSFPDNTEIIYQYSLFECPKLETVIIPRSVKKIEFLGIRTSRNIKNIIYEGTMAEWEAIDLANFAIDLAEYTVVCTDGELKQTNSVN